MNRASVAPVVTARGTLTHGGYNMRSQGGQCETARKSRMFPGFRPHAAGRPRPLPNGDLGTVVISGPGRVSDTAERGKLVPVPIPPGGEPPVTASWPTPALYCHDQRPNEYEASVPVSHHPVFTRVGTVLLPALVSVSVLAGPAQPSAWAQSRERVLFVSAVDGAGKPVEQLAPADVSVGRTASRARCCGSLPRPTHCRSRWSWTTARR